MIEILGDYPDLLIEPVIKSVTEKESISIQVNLNQKVEWNTILALNSILVQAYLKKGIESGHHVTIKDFEIPLVKDFSKFSLEASVSNRFEKDSQLFTFKNDVTFYHNHDLRRDINEGRLEVKDIYFRFQIFEHDPVRLNQFFETIRIEDVYRNLFRAAIYLKSFSFSQNLDFDRFKQIGIENGDFSRARFSDFGYRNLEQFYFLMKNFFNSISDEELFKLVDNYKVEKSIYLDNKIVYSLTQSQIKEIETYL